MSAYYYQCVTESGSFSNPMPDEYEIAKSKAELEVAFREWMREVRSVSSEKVSLVVFKGKPEGQYPCDIYPDFVLENGVRDGIKVI